jgi:hypothetical protein
VRNHDLEFAAKEFFSPFSNDHEPNKGRMVTCPNIHQQRSQIKAELAPLLNMHFLPRQQKRSFL